MQKAQLSLDFIFALIAGLILVLLVQQLTTSILDSAEQNAITLQHNEILNKTKQLTIGKFLLSDGTHDLNYSLNYPINCIITLNPGEGIIVTTDSYSSHLVLADTYLTPISSDPFYCGGLFND